MSSTMACPAGCIEVRVSTGLHVYRPLRVSSGAGLARQTHRYGRIRSNGFSTPYLHANKYGLDCSAGLRAVAGLHRLLTVQPPNALRKCVAETLEAYTGTTAGSLGRPANSNMPCT